VNKVAKGHKLRNALDAMHTLHKAMEAFFVTEFERESTVIWKIVPKIA
jgi:hypothetical protein